MRKKPRYHSLKTLRVRQDWSRWSLYSISQMRSTSIHPTYFQQKWKAKAMTRAYHGEQIREKKWKRQFKRSIPAVVPMNHKYLAQTDGSEQAQGRGAGVDTIKKPKTPEMTPYMQMTYWPTERRLDTAIFRALFASSTRQARQFVVHGLVKVNGKKMIYPGYMLNPGDMFQVEPESVMFATGAPKKGSTRGRQSAKKRKAAVGDTLNRKPKEREPTIAELAAQVRKREPTPEELKRQLQWLKWNVERVLTVTGVGAKGKQRLREFRQEVKKAIAMWKTANPEQVATLDAQMQFLTDQLTAKRTEAESKEEADRIFSAEHEAKLKKAFEKLKEEAKYDAQFNQVDSSKPYATPWRPRDYMPAFAFIPRYLEVNQNICAAVYLRHPVARPGLAEVPTPFTYETGQLAFNWYLRRR